MGFRYKPAIRIISIIVLFFFCWTFGGMVDIAYAIKNSEQPSAINNQQKENNQKSSQGRKIDPLNSKDNLWGLRYNFTKWMD